MAISDDYHGMQFGAFRFVMTGYPVVIIQLLDWDFPIEAKTI